MTFSDDSTDLHPVETTPLIPRSPTTSKRVRSYTNTFGFLPKRRLRKTSRPTKLSDKSQIHIVKDSCLCRTTEYDSDEGSSNLTAPSFVCGDEGAARESLGHVVKKSPPSPKASSVFSRRKMRILSRVSLTLENTGSVARDHLASERTFLAYMRTSLALASSGVALVQLFTVASASPPNALSPNGRKLHTYIRPLGATTIVMGLIVLLIGVTRYFTVQAALTKGFFPAARVVAGAIAFAMVILVTLTFAILLAGKLEPGERRHH